MREKRRKTREKASRKRAKSSARDLVLDLVNGDGFSRILLSFLRNSIALMLVLMAVRERERGGESEGVEQK